MQTRETKQGLDDSAVFWGFWWGLLIGVGVALWQLPKDIAATRQKVWAQSESLRKQIQSDPITESLNEGKALARQVRQDAQAN